MLYFPKLCAECHVFVYLKTRRTLCARNPKVVCCVPGSFVSVLKSVFLLHQNPEVLCSEPQSSVQFSGKFCARFHNSYFCLVFEILRCYAVLGGSVVLGLPKICAGLDFCLF